MPRKKKVKKQTRKGIKKQSPRISFWGAVSFIFSIMYMSYFLYLLYVFHVDSELSFTSILYAFCVAPFGILSLIFGVSAVRKLDFLGFSAVISTFIGMTAYGYIWYEILAK